MRTSSTVYLRCNFFPRLPPASQHTVYLVHSIFVNFFPLFLIKTGRHRKIVYIRERGRGTERVENYKLSIKIIIWAIKSAYLGVQHKLVCSLFELTLKKLLTVDSLQYLK